MKKNLINPVVNNIRSASYESPRYNANKNHNTYAQSIENMAGAGYNIDSKKLRTLYNDAKGIAIGARKNPETNSKRFWGLYGQQANEKPYQSTKEMSNAMRQSIDELRYGNSNRRITKNQSIKKESYFNTFGGGNDPNVVVTPKKGRPYKGQQDSLPLVSKRQKNITKASNSSFNPNNYWETLTQNWGKNWNTSAYDRNANINSEKNKISGAKQLLWGNNNFPGILESKNPKIKANSKEADIIARNFNRTPESSRYATNIVSNPVKSEKPGIGEKIIGGLALGAVGLGELATPQFMQYQTIYPALMRAGAKYIAGKTPKILNAAGSTINALTPYWNKIPAQGKKLISEGLEASGKYWNKIPANRKKLIFEGVEATGKLGRFGAKILKNPVKALDYAAAASSIRNATNAFNRESQYQYPLTMSPAYRAGANENRTDPYLPEVVSEKKGIAANSKFDNFVPFFRNLMPEEQRTNVNPMEIGVNAEPVLNPYQLLDQIQALGEKNVTGEYSESEGRRKLPPKFSMLPLREQQEYARFGRPTETRLKPNLLRAIFEGAISAPTSNMLIEPSYTVPNSQGVWDYLFNQNKAAEYPEKERGAILGTLNDIKNSIDYNFLDQMSHRGMGAGVLTETQGYDPNGDLKTIRVLRRDSTGQNMLPLTQYSESDEQTLKDKYNDIQSYLPGYNEYYEYVRNPRDNESLSALLNRNIFGLGEMFYRLPPDAQQLIKEGKAQASLRPRNEFMYGSQLSGLKTNTSQINPTALENQTPYFVSDPNSTDRDYWNARLGSALLDPSLGDIFPQLQNTALDYSFNPGVKGMKLFSNIFGKSMKNSKKTGLKKSLATPINVSNKVAFGKVNAKPMTKSLGSTKTLSSKSTSVRHSNKYMK